MTNIDDLIGQVQKIDPKIEKFIKNLPTTKLNIPENIREKEQNMLSSLKFPNSKNERWRFTRTNKIEQLNLSEKHDTSNISIDKIVFPLKNVPTIVFINGYFYEPLSKLQNLPKGLTISPISEAKQTKDWIGTIAQTKDELFQTINTLYAQDGAFIFVKKNTIVDVSLQIVNVLYGENAAAITRNLIVAEPSSQVEITQVFVTQDAINSMSNSLTECYIDENAHVVFNKIQSTQNEQNFYVDTQYFKQQKDSTLNSNTITINSNFVRNDLWVLVEGENAKTDLNGVYKPTNKQHVDNHISVEHVVANCESNQLYKGIVDDKATAVFNGRVVVAQKAQKINAYQSNANVLLSDQASINSKPELEIFADDVKCSHGTTIGQIDKQAIYYMQTRGISIGKAQYLLINAFIEEVTNKINNTELQQYVIKQLLTDK